MKPTQASKLLHTMQQPEINDEDIVITFDDDRIYPADIVQALVAAAGQHPDKVIATAGWAADRFGGAGRELTAMGEPRQPLADAFLKEGFIDVVIGACGTLYRKAFFDEQWLDYDGFAAECTFVDDVWFSGQLERKLVERWLLVRKDPARSALNEVEALSDRKAERARNDTACFNTLREAHGIWTGDHDAFFAGVFERHERQFRLLDEL